MTGLSGDAEVFRRVVTMFTADRRQIAVWGSAVRATGIVTRWQSSDLRKRSNAAVARSQGLCLRSAELRQEALALRGRWRRNGG